MVEIRPTNSLQRLRLKGGRCLDRLLGDFVFVAGWNNAVAVFEMFNQRGADFFLEFDNVAEALVFGAVGIQFFQKHRCLPHA